MLYPVSCILHLYLVFCILYPVSCTYILYVVSWILYLTPISCMLYPVPCILHLYLVCCILYPVSCTYILYAVSCILYLSPISCMLYPVSCILHLYLVCCIMNLESCFPKSRKKANTQKWEKSSASFDCLKCSTFIFLFLILNSKNWIAIVKFEKSKFQFYVSWNTAKNLHIKSHISVIIKAFTNYILIVC